MLSCRKDFPSLKRTYKNLPLAYFDGPGGTQVPRQVIDAMVDYYEQCKEKNMYNTTLFLTIICIIFSVSPEVNAQDHENVEQVGRIYNFWDSAQDVVVVGELAYVATRRSGLQIW